MSDRLIQHQVRADWVESADGPEVMLTQDEGGLGEPPNTVMVHPWQLRSICEKFGIVSTSEEGEREIAALKRRMVVLRDRIDSLLTYMRDHSDTRHADLSFELVNLVALSDLADEWCADFEQPEEEDHGQVS